MIYIAAAIFLLLMAGCAALSGGDPPLPGDAPAVQAGPAPEPEPEPAPAPAEPPPSFDLVAVGDVMLDYLTSARLRTYDVNYPFALIAPVLKQGELVFANLESPLSTRGEPMQKLFTFRAYPFAVDALAAGGINLVSLANNHILDYGTVALLDTLELLAANGIAFAGAGPDEAAARRGARLEVNGVKVSLLAYSGLFYHVYPAWRAGEGRPGTVFYMEREAFCAAIQAARDWADVVIVSMHWGDEYTYRVNREQREMGKLAIDSGADLVLGHHTHTPQGIEIYRGKPIVYSLGNFLFYPFTAYPFCDETYILKARVGVKGVTEMRLLPVLLGDSQPYPATGGEIERLHALLTALLDELGTPWEIDGAEIVIRMGMEMDMDGK